MNPRTPINELTLPEITQFIEETFGFTNDHVINTFPNSYTLEHPLRCRLMQYDSVTGAIHSLTKTCALDNACANGFAEYLWTRYGTVRMNLSPHAIHEIMRQHEEARS